MESVTDLWRNRSDSLRWLTREGTLVRGGWVLKARLMSAYSEFCAEHDTTALDAQKVGLRLAKLVPGVRPDRRKIGKLREKIWVGVSLPPPSGKHPGRDQGGRGGPPRTLTREEEDVLVQRKGTDPSTVATPATGESDGSAAQEIVDHIGPRFLTRLPFAVVPRQVPWICSVRNSRTKSLRCTRWSRSSIALRILKDVRNSAARAGPLTREICLEG